MNHSNEFQKVVANVMANVQEVSGEEVKVLLESQADFHLIDVREDHEWQQGNIKGARHLARGILERDIVKTIPDKSAHIVLYCGGGYRSALSADVLQKMGYTNVFSMAGGYRAWSCM